MIGSEINKGPKRKRMAKQASVNTETYLDVDLEEDDFVLKLAFVGQAKEERYEVEDDHVDAKATKAGNAKVPEHLWNDRIAEKLMLTCKRTRRKELGGVCKHSTNMTRPFKLPLIFKRAVDQLRFRWALKRI